MIGPEFVMPDPDSQNTLEDKLNREDQLDDAIDTFEAPDRTGQGWWIVTAAAVGSILAFTLYGMIYP